MAATNALSTDKILDAALRLARILSSKTSGDHLDIGAGHGELIKALRAQTSFRSQACDYTAELMRADGVPVDVVDLNTEKLPYPDAAFDLVTCTEVVEHIEHYRETLREIHRVLRPGGVLVVTTPNILNLKSRLRFLFFGFYNLFGPLHMQESRRYSAGGHINPVSLFYLTHSLVDAGFQELSVTTDKPQRGMLIPALLLAPLICAYTRFAKRKAKRKYQTIDEANERFVDEMNSWKILLGRTIVVGCRK